MLIKVKEITEGCFPVRTNGIKSDCFDLCLAEDVVLKKGQLYVAKLGIAMELPRGMVAMVYSRSSCPTKLGIGVANSVGYIDNAYNGDTDEWRLPIIAYKAVNLKKGTRVCQFKVSLSQFATFKQKLKWLFSNKVILKKVEALNNSNRGGIGSSGI